MRRPTISASACVRAMMTWSRSWSAATDPGLNCCARSSSPKDAAGSAADRTNRRFPSRATGTYTATIRRCRAPSKRFETAGRRSSTTCLKAAAFAVAGNGAPSGTDVCISARPSARRAGCSSILAPPPPLPQLFHAPRLPRPSDSPSPPPGALGWRCDCLLVDPWGHCGPPSYPGFCHLPLAVTNLRPMISPKPRNGRRRGTPGRGADYAVAWLNRRAGRGAQGLAGGLCGDMAFSKSMRS